MRACSVSADPGALPAAHHSGAGPDGGPAQHPGGHHPPVHLLRRDLGEISAFYTTFQGWDTILHTLNGFLCAAIGFALVDLCNRHERVSLSLSPVYMAIVAFCFSMTIGVLWEFFECAMDQLFLLDMQKDAGGAEYLLRHAGPHRGNNPVVIRDIADVIVVTGAGEEIALGLGGYLDIGILDTMKDIIYLCTLPHRSFRLQRQHPA